MRDEFVHDAIEPLLIEYAAGVLNADGRRKVESHLMDCDSCRHALEEWRQIADAARRETPSQALPPLDWQRIKGETPVILAHPRGVQPRRTLFQFAMPAAFVALMIGAAMLFAMMGGGGPSNNGNFAAAPNIEQRATEVPVAQPSATSTVSPDAQPVFPTPTMTVEPTVAPPDDVEPFNGFNLKAIPPDVRPVIVAANNIENGAVIKPHDLTVYLIFTDLVPEGAEFNPEDIVYTIARSNISCGQILTLDYSVTNARDVPVGQSILGDVQGCQNIERTYRPGMGGVSRDYDGRLYPQPVGETANVLLFTRDIVAGSVITEEDVALAPDYPIELVPPYAATDPELIVGRTLIAPVLSGQIVAFIPMREHTNVVIMQETVEMPEDAQVGESFDVYTTGDDPETGILVVSGAKLTYMENGGLILEVPQEYGPALQELASDKAPIQLVPSE
jgi:flagella basal body P-ring formation protein FlgA